MTGKQMLNAPAASLAALISEGMERVFGPGVRARVLGALTWGDIDALAGVVVLVLLAHAVAAWLLRGGVRRAEAQPGGGGWRRQAFQAAGRPLYLLIWICGVYLAATVLLLKLPGSGGAGQSSVQAALDKLFDLGVFVVLLLVFVRLTRVLETQLAAWASKAQRKLDDLLVPLVGRSLRLIVPVVGILFALPLIHVSPEYSGVLAKGSSMLIIGTVAWILSQAVHLGEKAVLAEYDITAADNLQARKVYTQVHVLSKTLYVIIAIFTVASILMLFDEVRRFGTSLLASAGVIGIIAGFAAQRTIANLFAGFQVAMTQPIRMDDVVIVEGEWGRIEEITLTYVVVHIWDERRLIVPLSHFIEKPFQNWTRVSAALLGSVFLWADYSLPVAELRGAVGEIVASCKDWDRRFWNVQVTDATERAMQIRVLATAADSGKAWDLRCEIREKLIEYIQRRHPQGLPRLRAELDGPGVKPPGRAEASRPEEAQHQG